MDTMGTRTSNTVAELLDSIAGGAPWRLEPMGKHVDSLSGSPFERAYVGEQTYVVKHISRSVDWLMRVLGDGGDGARPRALILWQEGLLDAMPPEIDHVIVVMCYDPERGHLTQVMRDVGAAMVPAGTDVVPLDRHRRFMDHLAAMHASFWGFRDSYGLTTPQQRYGFAHPVQAVREAAAGHTEVIPGLFGCGWEAMRMVAPEAAERGLALA